MRIYGDVRIIRTTINPVSPQVVMFMDVWQMPMFFFLSGVFFNIFYFKISKDICPPIHIFISQNKGRCLPTFSGLSRNTAQISKLFCFLLVDFLKPPFKHLTCVCLLLVDFLKACFKHVKGVRLLCPQQTDSQRVQGGTTP